MRFQKYSKEMGSGGVILKTIHFETKVVDRGYKDDQCEDCRDSVMRREKRMYWEMR